MSKRFEVSLENNNPHMFLYEDNSKFDIKLFDPKNNFAIDTENHIHLLNKKLVENIRTDYNFKNEFIASNGNFITPCGEKPVETFSKSAIYFKKDHLYAANKDCGEIKFLETQNNSVKFLTEHDNKIGFVENESELNNQQKSTIRKIFKVKDFEENNTIVLSDYIKPEDLSKNNDYCIKNVSLIKTYLKKHYFGTDENGKILNGTYSDLSEKNSNLYITDTNGTKYKILSFDPIFKNEKNISNYSDLFNTSKEDISSKIIKNADIKQDYLYSGKECRLSRFYNLSGEINGQKKNFDITNNCVIDRKLHMFMDKNGDPYILDSNLNSIKPEEGRYKITNKDGNFVIEGKNKKIPVEAYNPIINAALSEGKVYDVENDLNIIGGNGAKFTKAYINKDIYKNHTTVLDNCDVLYKDDRIENWNIVNDKGKLYITGDFLKDGKLTKINSYDYELKNVKYADGPSIILKNGETVKLGYPSFKNEGVLKNQSTMGDLAVTGNLSKLFKEINDYENLHEEKDSGIKTIKPLYNDGTVPNFLEADNNLYIMISNDKIINPENSEIESIDKIKDKIDLQFFAKDKDIDKIIDMTEKGKVKIEGEKGIYYLQDTDDKIIKIETESYIESDNHVDKKEISQKYKDNSFEI